MSKQKQKVICPKCSQTRIVSMGMVWLIKSGGSTGNCRSCSSKGNQRRLGHRHSDETKRKMSVAHVGKRNSKEHRMNISKAKKGKPVPHATGQNHWKWIDDRTKLVKSEKKHLDSRYKIWMKSVKERDGWKCRIADETCEGRLEAHHILNWVDFPELRYKTNNGITLCHAHHPRGRADEAKLSPFFQKMVVEVK